MLTLSPPAINYKAKLQYIIQYEKRQYEYSVPPFVTIGQMFYCALSLTNFPFSKDIGFSKTPCVD